MKYPKFLPEHGTIGFIAPSFGCNIEPYHSAFRNALKNFEHMGYQTQLGPNVYEGSGIGISSTPQSCAKEIMDYYCTKGNDVLISCGGGELMCEDLNHVDFDLLKDADPKWFLGYSDNTNLAFTLTTLCDTATIYGPCAPAFGMEPWHPSLHDAFGILTGSAAHSEGSDCPRITIHGYDLYETESKKDAEHPLEPYHVTEPCRRIGYRPAMIEAQSPVNLTAAAEDAVCPTRFNPPVHTERPALIPAQDIRMEGRLIGGCLDTLVNLLGTRFDRVSAFQERYKEDGILWFLEACDLNVMSIRRAIWQMEAAGWFRHTKGVLVGRPYHHGEEAFGLDQYHAVTDLLAPYQIPVIMDLDIGHIPPMMPLILGSYATAELSGNDFSIQMELR